MLAACYVAAEIILPIVLAFMLNLVLTPAMRVLERVHLPRGGCGDPRHPGAVWHAWRAGDDVVRTGGQLGAKTAQWDSEIGRAPQFSEPADRDVPEIHR
jgi:hypothetical protein